MGAMNELARQFANAGFVFPVKVFDSSKALAYRQKLESLEERARGRNLGNNDQLNYPHVIFRFAYEIACQPKILDAVEAILGPDVLVWGSTFFIKEPRTENFVSWHQDLRYWGLDCDAEVSAWLALSPVSEANGCMRFVAGSHHGNLLPHVDTFDHKNVLTRGQKAVAEIDEARTVCVPLQPGQASFHHGKLLHSSGPNQSGERRIGLAINYIAPHVRQVVAVRDFAMLVRGADRYGNFDLVPPPDGDLTDDAMAWHETILATQNEAMYENV